MIEISKRAKEMVPSATLAMSAKAKRMKEDGIDVISFAAGEPDFTTPDAICQAAIQAIDEGDTHYTPSAGIPALRAAICKKLSLDNGLEYSADEVTVTCGAKQAIYNALQVLIDAGDEVLIPAPFWVSYPEQVKLAGGTPVVLETKAENSFKLVPAELEGAITERTRAIILNYPSNPTGSTYSGEELAELGKILAKHNVAIVSDEIYEKLIYGADAHVSIAKAHQPCKDITIVVNGVSKAYAMTGWRMGYAAGSKEVISKMSSLTGQQTSGIPGFVQQACIEALAGPQDDVVKMRSEFAKRREIMHRLLCDLPGIHCHLPDGAFYLLPDVSTWFGKGNGERRIENSTDLANYLLEEARIATVSGDPFGAPGYIRLSYATSREKIEEGMKRMAEALTKLK